MPSATSENITSEEPPSNIDPYQVLEVERSATADQIKTAYRKQALKHHPAPLTIEPIQTRQLLRPKLRRIQNSKKSLSHTLSSLNLVVAHAMIRTGRTDESLDLDDDDFNWTEYFRFQYKDIITSAALEKFKGEYQGSDEERGDILAAYEKFQGEMDGVFEDVMLSNPLEDEDRFRKIIDKAIADGEVQAYDTYTKETKAQRKKRAAAARKEEREARELAEELGVAEKLFGEKDGKKKGKKDKASGEDDLAALIQQRNKDRGQSFLDRLEEKYAPKGKAKGKRAAEEPPEEAFQKNSKKGRKAAAPEAADEPAKKTKRARKA